MCCIKFACGPFKNLVPDKSSHFFEWKSARDLADAAFLLETKWGSRNVDPGRLQMHTR